VVPDSAHRGMWRVRWRDGRLSDMTNLTRAKDAVACFMETEERRQRGRHSPLEGRQQRNERQFTALTPQEKRLRHRSIGTTDYTDPADQENKSMERA
jgi:hypothetical protein